MPAYRCRNFSDSGAGKCTPDCAFVHPSDPEWPYATRRKAVNILPSGKKFARCKYYDEKGDALGVECPFKNKCSWLHPDDPEFFSLPGSFRRDVPPTSAPPPSSDSLLSRISGLSSSVVGPSKSSMDDSLWGPKKSTTQQGQSSSRTSFSSFSNKNNFSHDAPKSSTFSSTKEKSKNGRTASTSKDSDGAGDGWKSGGWGDSGDGWGASESNGWGDSNGGWGTSIASEDKDTKSLSDRADDFLASVLGPSRSQNSNNGNDAFASSTRAANPSFLSDTQAMDTSWDLPKVHPAGPSPLPAGTARGTPLRDRLSASTVSSPLASATGSHTARAVSNGAQSPTSSMLMDWEPIQRSATVRPADAINSHTREFREITTSVVEASSPIGTHENKVKYILRAISYKLDLIELEAALDHFRGQRKALLTRHPPKQAVEIMDNRMSEMSSRKRKAETSYQEVLRSLAHCQKLEAAQSLRFTTQDAEHVQSYTQELAAYFQELKVIYAYIVKKDDKPPDESQATEGQRAGDEPTIESVRERLEELARTFRTKTRQYDQLNVNERKHMLVIEPVDEFFSQNAPAKEEKRQAWKTESEKMTEDMIGMLNAKTIDVAPATPNANLSPEDEIMRQDRTSRFKDSTDLPSILSTSDAVMRSLFHLSALHTKNEARLSSLTAQVDRRQKLIVTMREQIEEYEAWEKEDVERIEDLSSKVKALIQKKPPEFEIPALADRLPLGQLKTMLKDIAQTQLDNEFYPVLNALHQQGLRDVDKAKSTIQAEYRRLTDSIEKVTSNVRRRAEEVPIS